MPARPYAGGITVGPFLPSKLYRGSYLPAPHELYTAFCAAESAGDSAMIAPGLRSRLGQPSSREPMPGAMRLSTVEWQSAHVMPSLVMLLLESTVAFTPTTAPNLSSSTVVAGLWRSTCPAWIAWITAGGKVSASTLSPTASAVVGSTLFWMTVFMCSVSVQNFSSP